jgi:hypothetical protein
MLSKPRKDVGGYQLDRCESYVLEEMVLKACTLNPSPTLYVPQPTWCPSHAASACSPPCTALDRNTASAVRYVRPQ